MSLNGTRMILAVALLCGPAALRDALADASGCSRDFSLGAPSTASDGTPSCLPGGDGCYECAYSRPRLGGYDICAEPADPGSEGLPVCAYDVPNLPNWWPDPVADTSPPDPPPPGDSNPSGPGDDGGTTDPGDGGAGGGGGGFYYYGAYTPPAYLYPTPNHRAYRPAGP